MDNELLNFLSEVFANEDVVIFGGIAIIIISTVFMKTVGSTIRGIAREKTRREIAAYIAEGSMSAEQGERLMKADKGDEGGCC